jgi:hypothetical protein
MTIKRTISVLTIGLAALGTGTATWLAGAGAALAPEPARATQALSGGTGVTAAAVFVNSNTNTSVVKWPTSWLSVYPMPEAGKPCSPYDLAAWQETTKVIVRSGAYAKCQ